MGAHDDEVTCRVKSDVLIAHAIPQSTLGQTRLTRERAMHSRRPDAQHAATADIDVPLPRSTASTMSPPGATSASAAFHASTVTRHGRLWSAVPRLSLSARNDASALGSTLASFASARIWSSRSGMWLRDGRLLPRPLLEWLVFRVRAVILAVVGTALDHPGEQ